MSPAQSWSAASFKDEQSIHSHRKLEETAEQEGFNCNGFVKFEESSRAGSRLESPVLFRLGFGNQTRMNELIYSRIPYKADTWTKVDVLLDW